MIELREEIPVEKMEHLEAGFKGLEIKNNTEDRKSEHEGIEFFTPVTEEGFEHYYISQKGRVFNSRNSRMLKCNSGCRGYSAVRLCKGSKNKLMRVHRLVAMAFIPNPEDKATVNHKNGTKTDNYVENLEWNTIQENAKHAWETGLMKGRAISNEQAAQIKAMRKEGESYKTIANEVGVSSMTVWNYINFY